MKIYFIIFATFATVELIDAGDDEKPKLDVKQTQQMITGATMGAGEGMASKLTGVKKKEDDSMSGMIQDAAADTAADTVMGADGKDPSLGKAGAEQAAKKFNLDKAPGAGSAFVMAGGMSDSAVGTVGRSPMAGNVTKAGVKGAALGAFQNGGFEAFSGFG